MKASTGAESSQAQPTPVVRLVAPGPTVAAQAPGTPVSWPTVVAMKPAEVSLAVSTNSTGLRPRASISGSTGPLGMPKTQRTPACSSMRTMVSTLVMAFRSQLRIRCPPAQGSSASWRERIIDRTVRRPVRGFSVGTFSMRMLRRPNSPFGLHFVTVPLQARHCQNPDARLVRPQALRDSRPPTRLTLAGNARQASRAVPEKDLLRLGQARQRDAVLHQIGSAFKAVRRLCGW